MKKLLPILLAFCILLTVPAYAAEGKVILKPAASGDNVTVTVRLENPGIIATRIFIRYDNKVLQLTDAKNGDVFPNNSGVFGKDLSADPYTMLWDESLRQGNNTTSGTLCTLTFAVKGGTQNGKTSVRVEVDKSSTFDFDLNSVAVADGACSVDVPVDTANTSATTKPAATTTSTTKSAAPDKTTTTTKPTAATKPSAAVNTATTTTTKTTSDTKVTTKAGAVTTTKAGATTTKPTVTQTNPAVSTASEKTTAPMPSANASSAASTAAAQGTTAAQPDDVKPAADPVDAATASAQDETIPDILPADGTLLSTASETQPEIIIDPAPPTNHRGLLWLLLLLIPAAVVVVLIVKKKSK